MKDTLKCQLSRRVDLFGADEAGFSPKSSNARNDPALRRLTTKHRDNLPSRGGFLQSAVYGGAVNKQARGYFVGALALAVRWPISKSARTTGLYNRRDAELTLTEVERILI
jgi:hypothetical protein